MEKKATHHSVIEFLVEWSSLNHFLTSYECERNQQPYVGFTDPRVQKLWNRLSKQEKKTALKRWGIREERELNEYFNSTVTGGE